MTAENKPAFKIVVEAGPNKGREFALPAAGARVGRATQNDVPLSDASLSRHHCRIELRGNEVWVVDLASANQTMVNGRAIEEARVAPADTITLGDTVLRVVPSAAADAAAIGQPVIDLGLDRRAEAHAPHRNVLRPLLWTIGAAAVLLIGATLILDHRPPRKSVSRPVSENRDLTLQIEYEKIEADTGGIFRYAMKLAPDGTLAVRIDNLQDNRHVPKEGRVDAELTRELARDIEGSGFFNLDPAYTALSTRPGALDQWDLTVIVGSRAHRCRVANRLEPEVFRTVREKIETFVKNELGLWATQYPRETLVKLARDACDTARKKFDERDIQYGNLAAALQRFKEAEQYLDTVDPKPDFYADIVSGRSQAKEEMDRRYQDQRFRADRAINLQDWPAAAQELRVLRELVPDRSDDRNKEATRKLLDVETRLKPHAR